MMKNNKQINNLTNYLIKQGKEYKFNLYTLLTHTNFKINSLTTMLQELETLNIIVKKKGLYKINRGIQ